MNIDSFFENLKALKYNETILGAKGFDEEHIEDILDAFKPIKNGNKSNSNNSLIRFIEEYDTSFSLISNISFNKEIRESNEYLIIGWVHGELPIALSKTTNEIVVLDFVDYDHVIFNCASSSDSFIDAFLVHGICRLDIDFKVIEEEWKYNQTKANEAAKLAGGDKYLPFWQTLYPTSNEMPANENKGLFN